MERLAREKIALQQRLAELRNELSQRLDVMEIDRVLRQTVQPEDDQASTSTASGKSCKTLSMEMTNVSIMMVYLIEVGWKKQKDSSIVFSNRNLGHG